MNLSAPIYVAGHAGLVGSAVVWRLQAGEFTRILTATPSEADLRNQPTGAGADPVHEAGRPGDVRDSKADPTNARESLGFVAVTALTQGLQGALTAYLSAHLD